MQKKFNALNNKMRSAVKQLVVTRQGVNYREAQTICDEMSEDELRPLIRDAGSNPQMSSYAIIRKLEELGNLLHRWGISTEVISKSKEVPVLKVNPEHQNISVKFFAKKKSYQVYLETEQTEVSESPFAIREYIDRYAD